MTPPQWEWGRDSTASPQAGASVADCSADSRGGYRPIHRQVASGIYVCVYCRQMKHTHLCAALQLRAICVRVICGVTLYFTLNVMVFGIIVAPVSGTPPVHGDQWSLQL